MQASSFLPHRTLIFGIHCAFLRAIENSGKLFKVGNWPVDPELGGRVRVFLYLQLVGFLGTGRTPNLGEIYEK
jgi:hypothetical protein